ncbi:MAG: ribosomal RNA small subunit methyltransferase A [Clostridia bacterium]|nr:ribosomal RNA small subunit methyltransferase A [Clostridia bacterium]
MEAQGLRPNQKLGQNFLVDPNMADAIVAAAGDLSDKQVIEIGPGAGALTVRLLEKAAQVTAVELDAGLFRLLSQHVPQAQLIHEDALKIDWSAVIGNRPVAAVANLPYYITTPLLFRLLQETKADPLVLMMQKEVVGRLCASPGGKEYGALSVMVQYGAEVETVLTVPPQCFYPVPKVDSAVVRIRRRPPQTPAGDEAWFETVVHACFKQRRKTLLNNLSALLGRDKARDVLAKTGIAENSRAEQLSIAQFVSLTNASKA